MANEWKEEQEEEEQGINGWVNEEEWFYIYKFVYEKGLAAGWRYLQDPMVFF